MRKLLIILILVCSALPIAIPVASILAIGQNYTIDNGITSGVGGGQRTSANYGLEDVLGGPAVGDLQSTNFRMETGSPEYDKLNHPPVADAGGPYKVAVGVTITLSGGGSDPDGDPLIYHTWSQSPGLGIFNYPQGNQNPTYTAGNSPGITTVTLVVDDGILQTSASTTLVIYNPNATITVTPYSVTYDGNAHTATGTATGVKGESLSGLDISGTTHTNVGDYPSDPWTFADLTGNYNNTSGAVHDNIKYGFNGLLDPYSSNKAYQINSSIPLKWQYTDAKGNAVTSSTALPIVQITSATGAMVVNDSGKSGYQYDATINTWQYNWQTKTLTPGTYKVSIISAQTGQTNGPFSITLK